MWVHGLRFLRHVAHQSCAFWVFNIYMFGPHAKRWWLSSHTHLSGYQWYRCFPSVGPLGPSLLFAWQQERLIWLRRGLLVLLWDDMIQFEHTHMHVYAWISPIELKWLVQRHVMNQSRSVWWLYDFRRTHHINVVKWYSNMHARITSIHMHVVVVFERYTPSRGYRQQAYIFVGPRGRPWSPWPTTR